MEDASAKQPVQGLCVEEGALKASDASADSWIPGGQQ